MLPLYENIKTRRKAMKMTQEELALRTGYTDRSSIARIEKGEIDLPQSKIKQFAEALDTTPSVLMGWVDEATNKKNDDLAKIIAKMRKNPELIDFMSKVLELSPEQFSNVDGIVSALVNK